MHMLPFFGTFGNEHEPSESFIEEELWWYLEQGWTRTPFSSLDMVVSRYPSGNVRYGRPLLPEDDASALDVVPGGWDHEHCSICSSTIEADEDIKVNTGYCADDTWICIQCHFALFGTDENQTPAHSSAEDEQFDDDDKFDDDDEYEIQDEDFKDRDRVREWME